MSIDQGCLNHTVDSQLSENQSMKSSSDPKQQAMQQNTQIFDYLDTVEAPKYESLGDKKDTKSMYIDILN